jgi:hypothetical protein
MGPVSVCDIAIASIEDCCKASTGVRISAFPSLDALAKSSEAMREPRADLYELKWNCVYVITTMNYVYSTIKELNKRFTVRKIQ